VARAYGVVFGERTTAARWTFYIGKDGKILHIDRQVNAAAHGKDVVERLKALGITG